MNTSEPRKTSDEEIRMELYSTFDDNEFLEAIEFEEAHRQGRISDAEYQKLVYVNKCRELLKGGDA